MWRVIFFTHRGRVRAANEDLIAIDPDLFAGDMHEPTHRLLTHRHHVLMIADGMGGHVNGALASRTALEFLTALPTERLADPNACAGAIKAANDWVYDLMQATPGTTGMGTTIVGVALANHGLLVFNIGDSRAYLHSPGSLIQLSVDGVPPITIDASRRRSTHAITQALGGADRRTPIKPHVSKMPNLMGQESILLCSDGLTDMLDDDAICSVLNQYDDLYASVAELNRLAMRGRRQRQHFDRGCSALPQLTSRPAQPAFAATTTPPV